MNIDIAAYMLIHSSVKIQSLTVDSLFLLKVCGVYLWHTYSYHLPLHKAAGYVPDTVYIYHTVLHFEEVLLGFLISNMHIHFLCLLQ